MSISGVEKFLDLAKTDENFKQNIIKAIKALQIKEGKSFNEDQLIENVIIPLAQKKGINFTEKDFLNYADKKTLELRKEDLPKVSGGIDKTSKAKLLLGVTLLGTSTAAAMNLAQLDTRNRHLLLKNLHKTSPVKIIHTSIKIRQFRRKTLQKRIERLQK